MNNLYVTLACVIMILSVVLIAKFSLNLDLVSKATGEMSLVQTNPSR